MKLLNLFALTCKESGFSLSLSWLGSRLARLVSARRLKGTAPLQIVCSTGHVSKYSQERAAKCTTQGGHTTAITCLGRSVAASMEAVNASLLASKITTMGPGLSTRVERMPQGSSQDAETAPRIVSEVTPWVKARTLMLHGMAGHVMESPQAAGRTGEKQAATSDQKFSC